MKIKMKRYYSGYRNEYQDFLEGQEYTVNSQVGQQLIDLDYAEEVKPPKATPKPRDSKTK